MIQTEGFILNGGGCDYPPKSTARKDPFPDSSSTPVVSIGKVCDDPSDPNYWKENLTVSQKTVSQKEENALTDKLNKPGVPLGEFAERLIALEQENVVLREELEQLKEVVAVTLCLGVNGLSAVCFSKTKKFPSEDLMKIWSGHIRKWAQERGIDPISFKLSNDGFEITSEEEAKEDDTKGTN